MHHDVTLEFSYDRRRTADTVERSLRPEIGRISGDRATAAVDRDDATILVTITAEDPRALRAAKATWFGLVMAAEGAVDAGSDASSL